MSYSQKKSKLRFISQCPRTFGFTLDGEMRLIYCGKWTCPNCQKRLARRWAVRAYKHIEAEGTQYYLLTLTLGSWYKSVPYAFTRVAKLWDRLRKQMRRCYGKDWQYLAFVEGQPKRNGMPHFHILTNKEPTAKRNKEGILTEHNLHNWAVKMGWGFEVDLKPVEDGRKGGWYVAKYASKQHPSTPKYFRRVRPCQTWVKLPKLPLLLQKRGELDYQFEERVALTVNKTIQEVHAACIQARADIHYVQ